MKRYPLTHCVLEAGAPVEVGRATGHFWFSSIHPVDAQRLLCEVVITADKAQGKWPAALYGSQDGGASWEKAGEIESYGPSSTPLAPRQLLLMPYEVWPLAPGDERNGSADGTIITWNDHDGVSAEPAPVRFLDFPHDLAPYHEGELCLLTNGNILPLNDGRLFMTVYGKFAGDTKDRVFAVVSEDRGFTWRFRSVVANGADIPDVYEGANESNTVRLADGRLLCVYRVGSGRPHPYHQSSSADEGATWTPPRKMEGVWSVEPRLVRLDNGLILL
ncbi:MAG: exo-alpha-sialidase, partial [Candidatus Latescibacteria bacterium]|nr:exo-alpha-sialidase [Candidatus Latescibacterota bacterium]